MGNLLKLKFKEADFAGKDIVSLSDTPSADGMSARELKERFDMIPKILIAMGKYNQLIDELDANGADAIGLTDTLAELRNNIQRLFDLEHPKTEAENRRVAAESERVSAENERKNAEQTRLQKEQERIGAETARIQSEAVRNSQERDRQHYENQRADAEANRVFEENKRRKSESIRQTNDITRLREMDTFRLDESGRRSAELKREEAEANRKLKIVEIENKANKAYEKATSIADAETARVDAERLRQSAEDTRLQKETERVQAEAWRGNAEAERIQAETSRVAAERARVEAEKGRVGSEQTRVDNDNYRYQLEIQRQANETVREENRQNFGYKGDWQNGAYKKYNMVSHKGKVYLANQDTSSEPPHADWVLLSSEGKSLRIGGKYDTVSALRSAYPNGDDKVYVVWGKIYAWTGKAWEQMGEFGGSVGIDKAEVIKIITPELAKKANVSHTHATADITNLLPTITNHVKTDGEIKEYVTNNIKSIFTGEQSILLQSLGEQYSRINEALNGRDTLFGENIAELMEQMESGKVLSEQNFTNTDKNDIKKALQDLADKVDKADGKGLSANDFTNDYKERLDYMNPLFSQWGAFKREETSNKVNLALFPLVYYYTYEELQAMLGNFEQGDWMKQIAENKNKLKTLSPVAIVNDLTTGGTNKALSAEQGKVLFQLSVDGKRQIAEAINGKTGNNSANENMTFEELKGEIDGLRPYISQTTTGNIFNAYLNIDPRQFIENNKSTMVVFPNVFVMPYNSQRLFLNCEELRAVPNLMMNEVNDAASMFKGCSKLETIEGLSETGNITTTNSMFSGCKKLKTIPLFDTQRVRDMGAMFDSCHLLETIPQLNTRNVIDMKFMFNSCFQLKTIPLLDTSWASDMSGMFYACDKLKTIPLLDTQSATITESMFEECSRLETIPQLNTNRVTNMKNMFYGCSSLTFVPKLDTSKVTLFSNMFRGCTSLDIPKMRAAGWEEKFLRTAPNYVVP